jgi:hypothetical protein
VRLLKKERNLSYLVTRWWGEECEDLSPQEFADVIGELEQADREHGDVSLKHESEWCLTYTRSGTMVFENVEDGRNPIHMKRVSAVDAARLWKLLAEGHLDAILLEEWLPGHF